MFRDFAKRNAERLNIVGTVRNEDDGSVRVVGEGKKEDIDLFLKHLKKGPLLARVDTTEITYSNTTGEFSDFKIIYAP